MISSDKWICSRCSQENGITRLCCTSCDKWRWAQLGLDREEARMLKEKLEGKVQ